MAATSFYCSLMSLCFLIIPFSLLSFANAFPVDWQSCSDQGFLCRGDAVPPSSGGFLLNKKSGIGQVMFPYTVDIWDSQSRKVADFTTHFTFTIDTLGAPGPNHGYGLTFFLAPLDFPIPAGSDAGFLGLFNSSNDGSPENRILAVEFDSFPNDDWDPGYDHVGINVNSIKSRVTAPWNSTLHRSEIGRAWIVYNSSGKNLSVYWSYGSNPNSSLSYQVDLKEVLPQQAIAGISATTGDKVEIHQLHSWVLFNTESPASEFETPSSSLIVRLLIAGGAVLIVGVLVAIVAVRKLKKLRSTDNENLETTSLTWSINKDWESEAGLKRFSYRDLVSATNSFSGERKLGAGGSGEVYKGDLLDMNISVAVKKFSKRSKQGKKQYINELKIISTLRHRNLVQLLGWCHEKGEFLLVYEYMPNGSLDCHLFGKKNPPLNWALRNEIAMGLASALLYLHEEWVQRVVHRDIKSSNIMLDSSFNVKLGDFGLAKFMDHELGPQTTGLAGTFGYLAPEYISTGKVSKESDVYSFGIVALEIATGRKSVDPILKDDGSETRLLEYVWDLYGSGKVGWVVDERLKDEFDVKQVECLLIVGLWCAHPNSSLRPSIRQAIQVLNFEAALPKLPTKMPAPTYDEPTFSPSSSSEPILTFSSADIGR